MVAGMEPNAENKLFVGGCPTGSSEDDLRALFEKHGQVEEVFVMRGGSRSGMACAFVRFATQPQAQAAIDAIHGRITLPEAAEPLVVRWADAPGSRRREGREGGRGKRNGGGRGGDKLAGVDGWPGGPQMMMAPNGAVYGAPFHPGMLMGNLGPQAQMLPPQALMAQPPQMGGQYGGPPYYAQGLGMPGGASYGNNGQGLLPMQQMANNPYAQQQMMVFMQEQAGMGGQQFWQMQQQFSGPPSPQGGPQPQIYPPQMMQQQQAAAQQQAQQAAQAQAAQAQQQAAAAQQQNATPTGAPQMLVANASMMPEGAPPLPLSAAPPRLS